jgi:predicted nucleotidyltransferase/DNA-binding CsgD family transcriptional regulator
MTSFISQPPPVPPRPRGRRPLPSAPASPLHGLLTDTQAQVLNLLLLGSPEGYYQREIAQRLGLTLRSVQEVLRRLVAAGIVRRRPRGRQVYYRADPDCPLLPELRGLLVKTVGLGDRLREALAPLGDRVQVAFVFGSWARGEQRPGSDVDLMVLGTADMLEVAAAVQEVAAELGREINAVVFTPASVAEQCARGEPFLSSVLDEPKVFLLGGPHELSAMARGRTD